MIRLRAVGECLVETSRSRIGPESEVAFAVLVVMLLAQGRPVPRRWLVELLWPAVPEERARHNLRQALYKLRQLGAPIETVGHEMRLPGCEIVLDPLLAADPEGPPPEALVRPEHPFGEFLTGYRPTFSAPFAAWLEEQRAIVHGRLRRLALRVLADVRRRASWGAVEMLARKTLQLDPLNEEATLALAEATALSGSRRAALAILDGYREEIGAASGALGDAAGLLRRRIAELLHPITSLSASESCFVGREESMAMLGERFRRVVAGDREAQALLVWGESGMGKSRFLTEFEKLVTLDGGRLQRVACQARDVDRPLSIFVDVVPELLALPGALGCDPESLAYLKRLTDHDPAVLEPSAATREAELLFAGVRQAIFDLIDAVASESPLVLCVEDVHWLDDRSWRVLRELVHWLAGRPVLVVATSQRSHDGGSGRVVDREPWRFATHRLPPLGHADSLALFDAVAGGSRPPPAFRDWCAHLSAGNPFFVRALAVHWLETGELRAPTSLGVLIDARVSRLEATALQALQACAVLGKNATFDRVEAVLQFPRHVLMEVLAELEEQGVLHAGGVGVPCKHELIATSALDRLTAAARRRLHRCAGAVLELEIERSQSASLLWDCAQQWRAAGEGDRALRLVRSCASHLLEVGLPHEAAEVYEQAMELCETDEERVEMLGGWATALRLCGRWAQVCNVLQSKRELHALEHLLYEPHSEDELTLLEAQWRTDTDIRQLLHHAESCARDLNASPSHRLSAAALALVLADNTCNRPAADRIFETVSRLLNEESLDLCTKKRILTIYHTAYGELDRAVEAAIDWIRLERTIGDCSRVSRALRHAATPFRSAGLVEKAYSVLRESYDIASLKRLASSAAHSADILATLNLACDNIPQARAWYDRAVLWAAHVEEAAAEISIRRVGCRLALIDGRGREADEMLALTEEKLNSDPIVRRRMEGFALYTDVGCQLDPRRLTPGLLGRFVALYGVCGSLGGQDFAVMSLHRGLSTVGRTHEANELLKKYSLEHRRERGPLPLEIKKALENPGPSGT